MAAQRGLTEPVPGQQRCVATANDRSVVLDLDQAHFTAIIVGLSVRRGLPARAAPIAMATVYQESGIRNLDMGTVTRPTCSSSARPRVGVRRSS